MVAVFKKHCVLRMGVNEQQNTGKNMLPIPLIGKLSPSQLSNIINEY